MLFGAYGPYFPREASPSRGGAEGLRLPRLGLASLRAGLGVGAGRPRIASGAHKLIKVHQRRIRREQRVAIRDSVRIEQ